MQKATQSKENQD